MVIYSLQTCFPTHHLLGKKCPFQKQRPHKENGIIFSFLDLGLLRARFDVILWLKKGVYIPKSLLKHYTFSMWNVYQDFQD